MVVNLDNDEVRQLNYESNLPKMPQSVCDNFKQKYILSGYTMPLLSYHTQLQEVEGLV